MARYKTHVVTQGETVQSIAQSELNDLSLWTDIVSQNNLKYPYIVETKDEKIMNPEHLVTWGDKLIMPVATDLSTVNPNTFSSQDQEYILSIALGRDLDVLTDTTDISQHGTSDEVVGMNHNYQGDIATVYGIANVKQSIVMRLNTAKGSLLLHPDYGSTLYELFGKSTLEQMQLISNEVIRACLTDTRVASCSLIEHSITQNEYTGAYNVTLQSIEASFNILIEGDNSGTILIS